MIVGAHSVISSRDPDADRAFLRDVLGLPHVDAGGGWLIFGLPPAEVAVHPAEENDVHELYLMCADVAAFVTAMAAKAITCEPVQNQGWGLLTKVRLPGGGKIGVYQPRHARPKPAVAGRAGAKRARPKPQREKAKGRTRPGARSRAKKPAKGRTGRKR